MKRKSKDCDTDQNIPLPIQNFLWRQTSPFVRAKLGNLCEASCVSFERVFVQNILHGLSPSLCDSMESVSRWKLVQAAFPHVMHCCASMLAHRKQTDPDAKFTNSETKLLYTLQWIILDAASECEDQEMEKTGKRATLPLHSLSMVQLFVYLFAPVILSLKEDMFQSLKLESGLRLWQALWDFRQPDIPCFASPVRPKRNVLKANRSLLKLNTNAANIYIGKGSSTDNLFLCPEPIAITSRNSIVGSGIGSPLAPLARMSDICGTLSDAQSVSMFEVVCELCNATQIVRPGEPPPHCNCSKRASRMSADMSKIFPGIDTDFLKQRIESAVATATSTVGIPPNPDIMSASYFDVSVLRCLFSPSWVEDGIFWGLKYIHNRLLEMNDECLRTESTRERSKSLPVPEITVSKAQGTQSPKHDSEEEKEKKEEEQPATTTSAPTLPTPQSTLYISRSAHCIAPQQTKDYPSKRFRATVRQLFEGKRSLARIESVEGASDKDKDEKKSETKKEFGAFTLKVQGQEEGTPPQRATSALAVFNQGDSPDDESAADGDDEQDFEIRRKSMPSLRNQMPPPTPVMTQAVSGNIPTTVPKVATAPCLTVAVCVPPITTHAVSNEQLTTVSSTNEYIGSLPGPPSSAVSVASGATSGNSSAGTGPDSDSNPSATTSPHTSQKDIPRALSIKPELCKPIITITEDSPSPSASEWSRKRESVASGKNENRPGMHRSLTDSNINYHWEDEIEEVTGSVHYIDARGRINLRVVLRAIHSVSMQDLTPRVCEVLLNITNVLLDMGVVSKQPDKAKAAEKKEENPNPNPDLKQPESEVKKDEEMPMHSMALDTVIRIFKSLGCPHGCGDGLRGSQGDHIRLQGTNCLQRLQRLHTSAFRRHLRNYVTTQPCQEVVDFLHAFLGFCNDAPPYSPAPHRKTGEDSKSKQTGFAINFGQSVNGSGPKGTEGEVIAHLLKPLVSRMMDMWKELHNHENISLYCDVRQLISYIKEQHGGTFRRVALSGLLDAIDRSKKAKRRTEVETPGNKGVSPHLVNTLMHLSASFCHRRTMSMTSDSGDEKECRSASIGNNMDECGTARNRRSLFKRKTKRNSKPNGGPQTSSGLGAASDSEMGPDDLGLRHIKLSPRMSMSATEDDPPSGPSTPKRKFSKFNIEANRRGSHEIGSAHQAETVVFKEKKMVNAWNVKLGMARFGFFLDCCQPGSVPDPQLVAAMLDLEAPVVARAALLLECANFVHRCNKGEWPDWMKFNLPSFRGVHAMHRGGGGFKRGNVIQRLAGKMFHMWGEALGVRLEQIIEKETKDRYGFIQQVKDESKKKELREEDEEEDFMDEATVNQTGSDCPHALKMVACQLLLEITTFLRETYQYVPKVKTMKRELSHQNRDRKFSVVLSSPVHSDRSSASFTEQAGSPGERKISFAVLGERSDSIHSSTTTLSTAAAITGEETTAKGRGSKRKLLHTRRNSGHNASFKRTASFKRMGSLKNRKVSVQSITSDQKEEEKDTSPPQSLPQQSSVDVESPGVMSDDAPESPEPDDDNLGIHMPWIKVVIRLANLSNFICDHQNYCHPNCYERQQRGCTRLMNALDKVYYSVEPEKPDPNEKLKEERKEGFREKMKRRESVFQPSSPIRRRESTPLLDKIKTDATTLARLKALAQQGDRKETKEEKKVEETPVIKYLKSQVQKLCHGPMAIMSKAAPVLSGEHFIDMLPVAWELLLENDQELSAAAASVLLLSAIKAPDQVKDMMTKELQHEDTNQRINAILRFSILWRLRYQVWPRMEEGAQGFFKVPPPSIDFVLPSPTIGLSTQPVVDASWTPYIKTKVEEMALNQEAQKSVVTATTTRRKQQQEMLHKALIAEEDRIRAARENFHVTNIAASQLAAHEPALHHSGEEHEEDAEEKIEHVHQPMQQAQAVFPSIICGAVLPIIHLLDDLEVNQDGISVSEVAEKVIWSCLVEDPPLFFRHFLEKLTNRDKQDELFFVLRRLILRMSELPAQTAHALFNYMVGYIMFYVRSPCEGSLNAIGGALSLLYLIVPHVNGISFKDLKQTLRKEQCDPTLLVTSNVPSAKKIIVHGTDLTSIPSQFPIHEDTQFSQILEDSIDFFNLNDDEKKCAFLVDTKSNQMHNLNSYVRDFYFFRRNFYPQLSMVMMDPDDAFKQLQRQAFTLKFVEIGKVLFSTTVLQSTPASQLQSHVNFLHEELTKLPSFPRKSLEAEFSLYKGSMGDEIYGMDMLHKFVWTKMLNTLFHSMNSNFSWMGDIPVFLSVINGTLLLHCDDISMLRFCLATYISISRHFKQVFATNGFMYIIPTMLRVYSNHQDNPIICQAIEFACKQFYILHRKPFILQMFGSIASIIDLDEHSDMIDLSKISPKCLYKLLSSMEQLSTDPLKILELVHGGGAMRALDFCYEMESESLTIIDAINVCVAVVAYASDSYRSQQMLVILDAIVPIYLKEVRKVTDRRSNASTARAEINNIAGVGVSMKALVNSCEALTRQISGPQRHIETVNTNMKPCTNHTSAVYYDDREDSVFKYMEEGNYRRYTAQDEDDEIRHEYRKPRDSLLNIAAEFYSTTLPRLRELRKLISDPNYKMPDLLDNKTHNRLADIALTLLKLAPYDTLIMSSRGLQRYMTEMLPITDWSVESVRPALNNILRRLDRLFNKIYKKPALRRNLNWDCAANLLKGLHLTLSKYRFIAHLPHLKTVINMCLNIILSDVASSSMNDSLHNVHHNRQELLLSHHLAAPPRFCSAVVKLMAMQMQCLGDQFSLEHICGGMSIFPTPEKTQNMLVNLILPLCIRVGSGRRDSPKIRQEDLSFALTVMLNAILPPSRSSNHKSHNLLVMGGDHMTRLGSISGSSPHERHNSKLVHDAILQTAFLGLKIMMVCFQKQLSGEWHRIAQCMKDLFVRQLGGVYLWKFLDFVVTVRPPIFIYLKPFIQFKVLKITCESEHEYYLQQLVAQRLKGNLLPPPRCSGTVLIELANELRTIKEEINTRSPSGGLGLLSTSPNVPPPPRTVVRQASLDKESISSLPESDRERERQSILRRQSTRRINASDGSKILEAIQGETEPAEEAEFMGGLGAETMEAMSDDDDGDPGSHRLQRADAKSRKTFKVKRSKTSIRKLPANRSVSSGFRELRDVREERLTPTEEESEPGLRQYIPKSKSEEGQFELQAMPHGSGGGTARARIARQGAQRSHASGVRSRSPSQSPILTRRPKSLPTSSSAPLQQTEPFTAVAIESEPFDQFVGEATYVSMPETYICRAESTDSISSCENAALLKEEEKNRSHNSLCIYFDGNDVQDTCV